MAFEAGRGGSGLEPKLAGLRLTPADFAGPRRRTPQDLGRILAGPGAGPSGPPVLGGPILECRELGSGFGALHLGNGFTRTRPLKVRIRHLDGVKARSLKPVLGSFGHVGRGWVFRYSMDGWWEKNVPLIHNISLQKIAIAYGSSWQSLLHAFGCPAG